MAVVQGISSAAKEDRSLLILHLFGISLLDDRASHISISLQHYGLLLSDSVGPGYLLVRRFATVPTDEHKLFNITITNTNPPCPLLNLNSESNNHTCLHA